MRARSLGWLMLSIFGCGIAAGSAAEPPPRYPYRMLISDMLTEKILILEKDGSAFWELSQPGWVMDGERLPNGHYLVAQTFEQAVVEYAPDGTIVRRFPHPGMTYGVSRLPSGNTVIVNFLGHGKDGKGISILEVTPQKQIVWSYREPRIMLLMQLLR